MLNLSVQDAKLQYIRNWQALQDFGIQYFMVKIGRSKKEVRFLDFACHGRNVVQDLFIFLGIGCESVLCTTG